MLHINPNTKLNNHWHLHANPERQPCRLNAHAAPLPPNPPSPYPYSPSPVHGPTPTRRPLTPQAQPPAATPRQPPTTSTRSPARPRPRGRQAVPVPRGARPAVPHRGGGVSRQGRRQRRRLRQRHGLRAQPRQLPTQQGDHLLVVQHQAAELVLGLGGRKGVEAWSRGHRVRRQGNGVELERASMLIWPGAARPGCGVSFGQTNGEIPVQTVAMKRRERKGMLQ